MLLSLFGGSGLFDVQRVLPHKDRDLLQTTAGDGARRRRGRRFGRHARVQLGERRIETFRREYFDYSNELPPRPEHDRRPLAPNEPMRSLGLRARIDQRFETLRHMDRALLAEPFVPRVSSNLPRVVFFVLPLGAFLVMWFFGGKDRVYVDHVVFAFHAHVYFFIIAIICMILRAADRRRSRRELGAVRHRPVFVPCPLVAFITARGASPRSGSSDYSVAT